MPLRFYLMVDEVKTHSFILMPRILIHVFSIEQRHMLRQCMASVVCGMRDGCSWLSY